MALNPNLSYPTRTIAPTAQYPYGAAQNVSSPNDGTGTPWVANIINDIWGFQQALLDAAGLTPSGQAEEVGASQYLDAINIIANTATGTALQTDGSNFMTGTLRVNTSNSDDLMVGHLQVQSQPNRVLMILNSDGTGLGAGTFQSWIELKPTELFLRGANSGSGTLSLNANDATLSGDTCQLRQASDGNFIVARTANRANGGFEVINNLTGQTDTFERVLTESDKFSQVDTLDSDSISTYEFTDADVGKSFIVNGAGTLNVVLSDQIRVGFFVNVTNHKTVGNVGIGTSGFVSVRSPAGGSQEIAENGYFTLHCYGYNGNTALWQVYGNTV